MQQILEKANQDTLAARQPCMTLRTFWWSQRFRSVRVWHCQVLRHLLFRLCCLSVTVPVLAAHTRLLSCWLAVNHVSCSSVVDPFLRNGQLDKLHLQLTWIPSSWAGQNGHGGHCIISIPNACRSPPKKLEHNHASPM